MNKLSVHFGLALACLFTIDTAHASVITLAGTITQDVQDSGSAAIANSSLNSILDGDSFTIILNLIGDLAPTGSFSTTSLAFSDLAAAAHESAFVSGIVVISSAGGFSQFSVLGCLIDAASCASGNQLALEFQIPTVSLASAPVSVQPIPSLLPMDLLEDGGSTDIHGVLTSYTNTSVSRTAPEPAAQALFVLGFTGLLVLRRNQLLRKNHVH